MSDVLESEPVTTVLHSAVQGFAERKTWTYAATLMRSPDFADALEAYCGAMVQLPEVAWPTDKVFAQKLRYLVAFVLIGNDILTLERDSPASHVAARTMVGA